MIACVQCEVPATVSIRPGPLTMTVNGSVLTVSDLTGSGAGWRVLASATGGEASLEGVSVSCSATEVNGPYRNCPVSPASPYPLKVTTATPVLEASADTGMGITSYATQWVAQSSSGGPVVITVEIQSGV